ncbi:hypothetical protein [Phaffia rhodozyma]|uniref:Uncharacterized protein n=1 Tax=Phaffia rhodozyma TaxID=264483 RepID=A0A0F7SMB3_PHARH|nr:hypothetical protein [Phaffia rhodozyma]
MHPSNHPTTVVDNTLAPEITRTLSFSSFDSISSCEATQSTTQNSMCSWSARRPFSSRERYTNSTSTPTSKPISFQNTNSRRVDESTKPLSDTHSVPSPTELVSTATDTDQTDGFTQQGRAGSEHNSNQDGQPDRELSTTVSSASTVHTFRTSSVSPVSTHLTPSFSSPSPSSHEPLICTTSTPRAENDLFPLGQPTLKIRFSSEERDHDVPPCFYPGQSIPTMLAFELPRHTSLPHALNPRLSMNLIGTWRGPSMDSLSENDSEIEERMLVNMGVSLDKGLDLWKKDAGLAWNQMSEQKRRGRQNPRIGLPGGKYTLPLTVQVPVNSKFPATFNLPYASFQVSYHLEATLTIDTPKNPFPLSDPSIAQPVGRVTLVKALIGFTLLPDTLPTVEPCLPPIEAFVPASSMSSITNQNRDIEYSSVRSASELLKDRFCHALGPKKVGLGDRSEGDLKASSVEDAWSVDVRAPTTTFSPTSIVPIDLVLSQQSLTGYSATNSSTRPIRPTGEIIVKAIVSRREAFLQSHSIPTMEEVDMSGIVGEEEIIASWGRFDLAFLSCSEDGKQLMLPRLNIPLGYDHNHPSSSSPTGWTHGFTTSLTVSAAQDDSDMSFAPIYTHCSSRFYVSLHIAYSPTPTSSTRAPPNMFRTLSPLSRTHIPSQFLSRSLVFPITIGSVGEPQGARHQRTWRELYIDRTESDGQSDERPRMVRGSAIDEDGSWIVPPPPYQVAKNQEIYVI